MSAATLDAPWMVGLGGTCLRAGDGRVLPLPAQRWLDVASPVDERLLRRTVGPVLDVGCGPARHVLALAQRGVVTLGIDVSAPAIALARRRGAPVLHRSIFHRVPGAGRWGTALLLDGNIGIGGDPRMLLSRVAELLRPGGGVLTEVSAEPAPVEQVRFESGNGAGPWFAWATVGVDELAGIAAAAGLLVREQWCDGERHFAWVDR